MFIWVVFLRELIVRNGLVIFKGIDYLGIIIDIVDWWSFVISVIFEGCCINNILFDYIDMFFRVVFCLINIKFFL